MMGIPFEKKPLAACVAGVGLMLAGAQAAAENEWVLGETPDAASVVKVYTSEIEGPAVMLECTQGGVIAMVSYDSIDFSTLDQESTRGKRTVAGRGRLLLNGEVVEKGTWFSMPSLKFATPGSKSTSNKVFNAIVRGDQMSFKAPGQRVMDVDLPPVDDAFREFNRQCKELRA